VEFSVLRRNWENQHQALPAPTNKFTPSELSEFLREIDTLMVSVPQTPLTTELIKMEELKLLGSEGLVVNVARGPIIREADFYTALKEQIIAGAGIDTWYHYDNPACEADGKKYPFSYPFHTLDNVILSPHRGASPKMDLRRWDDVLENICRFAMGNTNLLNMINIDDGY
jgi:phosphoglycerate dehydrogenase-like enzyme